MKSKFNKYGLSIVLVLAFVLALSSVFAANTCYLGLQTLKFNPSTEIVAGTSFSFNIPQTVYSMSLVKVTWKDEHKGCAGRLEFPNMNTTWKDIASTETQSFRLASSFNITSDVITMAVDKKKPSANCEHALIFKIIVMGLVGNCSSNTNSTDKTPPTIIINSPNQSTYNSSEILFDFNVSDNSTFNVWFNYNGTNIDYLESVYLNLTNGNYNLSVYANDSAGNLGLQTFNFIVNSSGLNNTIPGNDTNSTLPIVNIISPLNGHSYNVSQVLLNATSNQLISNWSYSLDNGVNVSFVPGNYSLTNLANGTHNLRVYANNSNGTGFASVLFYVSLNNGSSGNGNDDDDEDTEDDVKDHVDVEKLDSATKLTQSNGVINLSGLSNQEFSGLRVFLYWGILLILLLLIAIVSILIARRINK